MNKLLLLLALLPTFATAKPLKFHYNDCVILRSNLKTERMEFYNCALTGRITGYDSDGDPKSILYRVSYNNCFESEIHFESNLTKVDCPKE